MARRGSFAIGGGLLLIAVAGVAFWSLTKPSAVAPSSQSFGFQDWLVRCQTNNGKTGCALSQQILDKATRQPVLQLHLARNPKGEGHQLVVVMPLGVSVPPGIAIEADKLKRNVAFTQCLPGGCVAPTNVDDVLLMAFKNSNGGRVGVVDRAGKTQAVPFSLKGFAPALEKMEEEGSNEK